jgi:hypothetical protein
MSRGRRGSLPFYVGDDTAAMGWLCCSGLLLCHLMCRLFCTYFSLAYELDTLISINDISSIGLTSFCVPKSILNVRMSSILVLWLL